MKRNLTSEPRTLGDVLAPENGPKSLVSPYMWLWRASLKLVRLSLTAWLSAIALWMFLGSPDIDRDSVFLLTVPILFAWVVLLIYWWFFVGRNPENNQHFLLINDRQRFMHNLQLKAKTAVFDGSNIYHLGHENGLDAQPLGETVHLLRLQGYRIVCFFDANIFFTLGEHRAYGKGQRHSPSMLMETFGLKADEIYVVPSGIQADEYILECLKHLPISFAVTNDKYRDYAKQYATVMKDNQWRKGVAISNGEIRLLGHRF
ncbi:MAG: hypothetical protein ABJ246_05385 [Paracoccaceae bacterium]